MMMIATDLERAHFHPTTHSHTLHTPTHSQMYALTLQPSTCLPTSAMSRSSSFRKRSNCQTVGFELQDVRLHLICQTWDTGLVDFVEVHVIDCEPRLRHRPRHTGQLHAAATCQHFHSTQ
jgi:hypothetical protein